MTTTTTTTIIIIIIINLSLLSISFLLLLLTLTPPSAATISTGAKLPDAAITEDAVASVGDFFSKLNPFR